MSRSLADCSVEVRIPVSISSAEGVNETKVSSRHLQYITSLQRMPKHRKIPVVRPSAYPGARLDSATWRSVFGASFKKAKNAVYPLASKGQTGGGPTGLGVQPSAGGGGTGSRRHTLTFVQNFGLLGFPILLTVSVSIAWTTLLLILNVAPNATANYIMNTAEFDDGSFWLIIDPSALQSALAAVGLGLVLVGYLYALLKLTWWMNRDLPDSSSNAYLARITRALVREGSSREQILEFWTDLTGYQGQRRKFWVRDLLSDSLWLLGDTLG